MTPHFEDAIAAVAPFPHASIPAILSPDEAAAALSWLTFEAPWSLRTESFYEQYEFSLLDVEIPRELRDLIAPGFIDALRTFLQDRVGAPDRLDLVNASAHKLIPGQTIRLHNDFIGEEETHRVLIQLNDGWSAENGGILMLFNSHRPEDVASAYLPVHASGFAFEISPRSFHAVSTIRSGERFTLVYTFRAS
ncbi:cyclophane-containing peptide 2OG-Fe(II) oxygenase YhhC [Sphingobium tyrosinilyticum]|uniref:Cyclophane-containing peptide 2OG-Fe(II) oxygenase YhhC n=1 Tax=Sphingobium tyrosinilyticum TaxID=2715436 RepID=A0ABV9F355_9SPHN